MIRVIVVQRVGKQYSEDVIKSERGLEGQNTGVEEGDEGVEMQANQPG